MVRVRVRAKARVWVRVKARVRVRVRSATSSIITEKYDTHSVPEISSEKYINASSYLVPELGLRSGLV